MPVFDLEAYARIEGKDGTLFTLYSDINRLERHMMEIAPEDKRVIRDFIKALNKWTHLKMHVDKAPELWGFIDALKAKGVLLPLLGTILKWLPLSINDFAERFRNPFLRAAFKEAVPIVCGFNADVSMSFLIDTIASMHLKHIAYPLETSLEIARRVERRYLELGGSIDYNARVSRILVENDPVNSRHRAVGVRLTDGREYRGDIVLSAADGRATIFDMLDGRYTNKRIRESYDSLPIFPPLIHIAIGVASTFQNIPPSAMGDVYPLDEPVVIAGKRWKWIAPHLYTFDRRHAPEGKTFVRVMLGSDYDYWEKRRQDPEQYQQEKNMIAETVIRLIDRRFPGFADHVEMIDVATPATFERYTGSWQGSPMAWLVTDKTIRRNMSKTLPKLDNFYMIGQWTQSGCISFMAIQGSHVVQIQCKKDKKTFITAMPSVRTV
jgi:phytoene dehydrogenase-like protein